LLLSAACAQCKHSLSDEICSDFIFSPCFSNTKPAGESVSVVSIDKFEINKTPADCTETIHFSLEMPMTNDNDSQYFYIASMNGNDVIPAI
jgi:hypothetical protein